jgi:hypothetical protein
MKEIFEDVDVFYGAGYWVGFTRQDAGSQILPPDHGPWQHKETWKIYPDYPFNRIVPENDIRAGIEKQGYHRCELGEEQIKLIKRTRGE